MNIIKKKELLTLKAKIKGLASEGRRTRKFIHRSKGIKRFDFWNIKRTIGKEARYHLIAYGLLRGLLYDSIEPNSDRDRLKDYLFSYSYLAQIIQRHCHYNDRSKWQPANIKRLMLTGTMSIPVERVSEVA